VSVAAGVLALQGDYAAHARILTSLAAEVREVRRSAELEGLDGLVIPGGESTALLRLMGDEDWFAQLRAFHDRGGCIFGTCAGAILLSSEVTPDQASLGLLDASIERNAYGRQLDSFETRLDRTCLGDDVPAVFIRAPRFGRLGHGVQVLARHREAPVLVQQAGVIAATFHPELARDTRIHAHFLDASRRRLRPVMEAS
jgi:5'-phosphate synthase pdxT subunit